MLHAFGGKGGIKKKREEEGDKEEKIKMKKESLIYTLKKKRQDLNFKIKKPVFRISTLSMPSNVIDN